MNLQEAVRPTAAVELNPRDPVFDRWTAASGELERDGFLWLPEHGMGRLRVTDPPYDADYFQNYVALAATQMGRAITQGRVDLVNEFTDRHVVDVGIGSGAFIARRLGWTWGYDVNPAGVEWLHAQGRYRDPYQKPQESISLWDVLEHIEEPEVLLRQVQDFVFVSLPIVPDNGPPLASWKHYKPREHCWYWTEPGIIRWMAAHGFKTRHRSRFETALGRQDIGSFVFEREREARR